MAHGKEAGHTWALAGLEPSYIPAIMAVYYAVGLGMVALTSKQRARIRIQKQSSGEKSHSSFGSDQADPAAVQVMRLSNRMVASTIMWVFPPFLMVNNFAQWNIWMGGEWCTPLDTLQKVLLHFQLLYYVSDTPLTLYCRDTEQIIHHVIGVCLVLPGLYMNGCGVPSLAGFFTEQGSSIFVRYVKMMRYFLPKYHAVERFLVSANYYMNLVINPFMGTPLLLRLPYQIWLVDTWPAAPFSALWFVTQFLAVASVAQCIYDWYWNTRMVKAYARYRESTRKFDAKRKPKAS